MKYCEQCGVELDDDMEFCYSCGSRQTPLEDEDAWQEELHDPEPEETIVPKQIVYHSPIPEENLDESVHEPAQLPPKKKPFVPVLIILGVAAAAFCLGFFGQRKPSSVMEMPADEIQTTAGSDASVMTEEQSAEPAPAEAEPATVEVTEAQLITVPDLTGLTSDAALRMLSVVGLRPEVVYTQSSTVRIDHVITQFPSADSQVVAGETVTLYISETYGNTSTEDISADYVLPGSDSRYITTAELQGFDAWKIRIAINEIYARHGRIFRDEELNAYFSSRSWYQPTVQPDMFSESVFNEYERENLRVLQNWAEEHGYR